MQHLTHNPVFILGAGASIAHNPQMPATNNFFSQAHKNQILSQDAPGYKDVKQRIADLYGIDIDSIDSKVNIEEFLTFLEIELEKEFDPLTKEAYDYVIFFIRHILQTISQKPGPNDVYPSLVRLVNPNASFITFNWDTLLDSALVDYKRTLHPTRYEKTFFSHQYPEVSLKAPSPYNVAQHADHVGHLLKLHGSLNWFSCSNRICRLSGMPFLYGMTDAIVYCGECHRRIHPIIIPPVLTKQYESHSIIQKVWQIAERVLSLASSVIIFGYSLPPTDFSAKHLLLTNKPRKLENLTLINPDVISRNQKEPSHNVSFIRHFFEIYSTKISKNNLFLYESFADFLDDCPIERKYGLAKEQLHNAL